MVYTAYKGFYADEIITGHETMVDMTEGIFPKPPEDAISPNTEEDVTHEPFGCDIIEPGPPALGGSEDPPVSVPIDVAPQTDQAPGE